MESLKVLRTCTGAMNRIEDEDENEEEDTIAPNAKRAWSNVEPEFHDVAVLDFVFFAFDAEFAGFASFCE